MPRQATAFLPFEPCLELVYRRDNFDDVPLPGSVPLYPELRYMGSKHRLLPWIHGVLRTLDFSQYGATNPGSQ